MTEAEVKGNIQEESVRIGNLIYEIPELHSRAHRLHREIYSLGFSATDGSRPGMEKSLA